MGSRSLAATGALNLILRATTMASKFVLVLGLARFLSPAEMGTYGLLFATLGFSLYLIGADFYTFSTRDLPGRPDAEWPARIRDQLLFHLVMYALGLPILTGLFFFGLLEWTWAPWLLVLLLLEHLSQEAYRLLVARRRPLQAGICLFLRAGAWALVAPAVLALWEPARDLRSVMMIWLCGSALGLLSAALTLRDLPWRRAFTDPVDTAWIKKGIQTGLPFLAGTLSSSALFTVDRYFLQAAAGTAAVGAYTFFFQLTNTLPVALDAAVAVPRIPLVVTALARGDRPAALKFERSFTRGVLLLTAAGAATMALGIWPLLAFVGHESYRAEVRVFGVLLAGFVLFSLGMIPHYRLYCRRVDRPLIHGALFGLAVAIAGHLTLTQRLGSLGAAISTTLGLAASAGWKTWCARSAAA